MTNKSKRLGTEHETAILRSFREQGYDIERLSMSGAQDEGDLLLKVYGRLEPGVYDRFVLEAKNAKAFTPAEWVKQAKVEAQNYATHRDLDVPHWVVVAKARNKPITEAYVITTLSEWVRQIDG